MENKLVIRELRDIAAVPNGYDEKILLQIQENLAVDVMRMNKRQFMEMLEKQKAAGVPPAQAEQERKDFFAQMLQSEYRNRTSNGSGFSLPLYVEVAENFYRLEIGRHLQAVKDYIAQGKIVAEAYQVTSAYEIRNIDAGMKDMAHRVADGLNAITDSLERLGRVKTQAAKAVTESLRGEMMATIGKLQGDRFAEALLADATTLAEAKRQLAAMEKDAPDFSSVRP